jgi:2-polyprenyl-6-methoxyphenol hydroxylase-like FAD-dependent oxidoreductase
MSIRVACIGGGPGGLFFSILLKRARPDIEVVVLERNQPGDVFGFGVVFSDRTLEKIDEADPVLRDALTREGVHWDTLTVSAHGTAETFAGNGMAAVHRRILLQFLQQAAADAGVDVRFGTEFGSLAELNDFDIVVGADGANSRVRTELEPALGHEVETAIAKFIWFGTTHIFEGLTFLHRRSEHGNFAAHAYPIGQGLSTFIVETDEDTWQAAGLDAFDVTAPPGPSDPISHEYLRNLFADDIAGADLVDNNSRWANFRTRRTRTWHAGNVVLLGDAVHTAHFSVGSGTKMAMEDAIVLAREIAAAPEDHEGAFARYQAERQPEVAHIQDAAGPSLSWWEHFGFYVDHLEPLDFALHFFSRSIDIERIRRRDPALAERVDSNWSRRHGAPPLESPLDVGGTRFGGRRLLVGEGGLADSAGTLLAHDRLEFVTAPLDERLAADTAPTVPGSAILVVEGGSPITRAIVAERARLAHGRVAVIVDDDLSDAEAATLILSGRTDAVAARGSSADV